MKYTSIAFLVSLLTVTKCEITSRPEYSRLSVKRAFDYATSDLLEGLRTNNRQTTTTSKQDTADQDNEPSKISYCSTTNPLTNGFYDLSELSSLHKDTTVGWSAKGHDYNSNFTLGICSSPVKIGVDINPNYKPGLKQPLLQLNNDEVGAIYTNDLGEKFSIGNFNPVPVFRGKKLTMTYENGSYCPNGIDRKSALLSFTCDKEILQPAQVLFVGVLHDCDYFFEVRTIHACPKAHQEQSLSVIWIFVIILLAAVFVYSSAGFLYKRIILNRRGWSPLPTYNPANKPSSNVASNWMGTRSSRSGSIRLDSVNDRFGFVEDQNNLLDSLDDSITEQV